MSQKIFSSTSLIPPRHYYSESIFELEKKNIFENTWHFAGFKTDLSSPNDYITLKIGDSPIVVQNFNGKIKSFLNVCSHRFAQIQEGKGNRAFFCPYHGWAYNEKGVPVGIPKKPKFGILSAETIEDLCLKEYDVAFCGNLVFVKDESKIKISIEEFLGEENFKLLSLMSAAVEKEIDCNVMLIEANWKLLVENTLEAYHVAQVHPSTFNGILGKQSFKDNRGLDHTCMTAVLNTGFEKLEHLYESRPWKLPGYIHMLVYPNLTVASSYGASFSFQIFEPISPTSTKFTSYVFSTKHTIEPEGKNARMVQSMNQSIVEFNRKVFSEDKDICEKVQNGVKSTTSAGLLSYEEKRVMLFQESYMKNLNKGLKHDS